MRRRGLLSLGGMAAGGLLATAATAPIAASQSRAQSVGRQLSVIDFGAVGDGRADDTAAIQRALDVAIEHQTMLLIPPGRYRITNTLRIEPDRHVIRQCGISAHGACLVSAIMDGKPVIEVSSRATVRFIMLEGLDIQGSGREGHGIVLACRYKGGKYLYNFCLRDVMVQNCGGDGCHIVGNVFEGQLINCYFRANGGNGATFAHSENGGVVSAIHVFASIFGDNGQHGAALLNKCNDVSFNGCYFLLNKKFGVLADNGCTPLSHCGFENNHQGVDDFSEGDAGIYLKTFGTLIGCTAYSIYRQTHLLRSFITNHLVMIGCTGTGGGKARGAGLARLQGDRNRAHITLIGCSGAVQAENCEVTEIGSGSGSGGVRFGGNWQSRNLPQLGDYRLWVDQRGRLRIKKGSPNSDDDGAVVGA